MSVVRDEIKSLKMYVPGRPIEAVRKQYGIDKVTKLASNENPLGASPKAVEAMKREAVNVNLYPDPVSTEISARLAEQFGVDASQIIVSNGMDNCIALLEQAFIAPGDEVLTCAPTFDAYRINCAIMGGKFVTVPLSEHRFDLNALSAAINEKTKLIFICNPNNPTGTIVKKQEVDAFMRDVPEHCIVMFDEAYAEFVTNPDYALGMKYVKEGRPVFVGRTFSKLYGLAGLRVGYMVAPFEYMQYVKRVIEPFPVNRIAQAAALAALDDTEFVNNTVKVNNEGIAYLTTELTKLGFVCYPANGNFMWVDIHKSSKELEEVLLKKGLILRPGHLWGFDSFFRISIGTHEQNKTVVDVFTEIIK